MDFGKFLIDNSVTIVFFVGMYFGLFRDMKKQLDRLTQNVNDLQVEVAKQGQQLDDLVKSVHRSKVGGNHG